MEVLKTLCVTDPVTFWSVVNICRSSWWLSNKSIHQSRDHINDLSRYQVTWQYSWPKEGFKPRKIPAFWVSGIWCVLVQAATVIGRVLLHPIFLLLEPYKQWAFMRLWKQKLLFSNGYEEVKEATTSDDINLNTNGRDFSPWGIGSLMGYPGQKCPWNS
jgi:hypothetical protein